MKYDIIVVGAGIVGLASAYQLLKINPRLKLLILEKESSVAQHQTGHNSGVIHSGIYYKPGSLKAKNCRAGYQMLIEFCDQENIKYEICGKLIVATSEKELISLNKLYERGIENGLIDIKKLTGEQLKEYEPHVNGIAGIYVPYTGIIDFRLVAEILLEKVRANDGEILFNEKVIKIELQNDSVSVITLNKSYEAKYLVTCAGLFSDRLARMTNKGLTLRIIPFRGEYYRIRDEKKYIVKNLIYPVPDPEFPFLGVHFTRMIDGKVEAGPNAVLAFKREGYKKSDINLYDIVEIFGWRGFRQVMKKYYKMGLEEFKRSFSKKLFVESLQKLIPEIKEDDLIDGGSGVRAQACDINGDLVDDFYFVEDRNVLHVCNAPSPAATASLSIGKYIAEKVLSRVK